MNSYPIPAYHRIRESARANFRQLLAYIFACSMLIAAYSGALDASYLATHPFVNIVFVALVLGTPLGIGVFILYKILGFAFPRLDFTHRYRRR